MQPGRPRLAETAGHQFEDPIADATVLSAVRDRLVSQLLDRIRDRYLAPQAMHLQLGFEAGSPFETQVIFPAPTADEGELQRAAGQLTGKIPIRSRITEIQVGLSKLQPLVGRQLTLFPTQADQERQLRQLITNLTRRYGRDGFRQPQVVDACLCACLCGARRQGARRQAGALVLERRFILNRWDHE